MRIVLKTKDGEETHLNSILISDGEDDKIYELIDENSKKWMKLKLEGNSFVVLSNQENIHQDEFFKAKLDQLVLDVIEGEQSGTEGNETDSNDAENPFNPEDIKVHAKQFSLRLISDMIEDGDIDLAPDFQRNLVWDGFQKSRLIESILLRIPLPMFYFSEDDEGRITIVDGLQRLTTIKEFMNNDFALRKLEYLSESCEGRYYRTEGKKEGIDAKYFRWFNQTQFSVNVIDSSSPAKVKYDIFRRINTGGKPLNNQEIRNCLAGRGLRNMLKQMADSVHFKNATDYSIRSKRMEDQEVALRFILFYKMLKNYGDIESYSGYMDTSLDDLTEAFYKTDENDLQIYFQLFENAMKNAEYLFGRRYAFRKLRVSDTKEGSKKKLINKALFVSWSVLLADFPFEIIKEQNDELQLLEPLAEKIEKDFELFNFLSYGTNGKYNLLYVFNSVNQIIKDKLNV